MTAVQDREDVGERARFLAGRRRPAQMEGSDAAARDLVRLRPAVLEVELSERPEDRPGVGTRVDQCRHEHVTGDPTDEIEVGDPCHGSRPRAINAPIVPAPTPSSTLTTATPGAHDDNIPRSAVIPPRFAP